MPDVTWRRTATKIVSRITAETPQSSQWQSTTIFFGVQKMSNEKKREDELDKTVKRDAECKVIDSFCKHTSRLATL
jgi:hypothetical protein